jgi:hypothetical protein
MAAQVAGCNDGLEFEAAQRLPALYDLLVTFLLSKCIDQMAALCTALRNLPLPRRFMNCISKWPMSLAENCGDALV